MRRLLPQSATRKLSPCCSNHWLRWGADWLAEFETRGFKRRSPQAIAYELARQDVTVEYIGAETLDGKPIEHLRLARVASTGSDMDDILTKNSQFEVFLDPETRLVLKVAFPWVSDVDMRRSLPFEIYYSDYRSAGGLLIPFAQRAVFNGKQVYELKVSSFAANVGLVDSDFSGRQP